MPVPVLSGTILINREQDFKFNKRVQVAQCKASYQNVSRAFCRKKNKQPKQQSGS